MGQFSPNCPNNVLKWLNKAFIEDFSIILLNQSVFYQTKRFWRIFFHRRRINIKVFSFYLKSWEIDLHNVAITETLKVLQFLQSYLNFQDTYISHQSTVTNAPTFYIIFFLTFNLLIHHWKIPLTSYSGTILRSYYMTSTPTDNFRKFREQNGYYLYKC